MPKKSPPPATKTDVAEIKMLIQQIQVSKTDRRDLDRFATKADLLEMEDRLQHYFDLVAENMREDFKGAFHDRMEQHEDRITRLEGRP